MSDDITKEISELKRRLAELEAKAKEEPVFVPDPELLEKLANYDPTEGMRMDGGSAKRMALNVGGKSDMDAWARERIPNRGGFGPGPGGNWDKGPTQVRPEDELKVPPAPKSYWSK